MSVHAFPQSQPQRQPPHNIEAEQALLGAILLNNDALWRVSDFLAAEQFFEPLHQQIYDVVRQLVTAGKVASPITVKTFLPEIDLGGGLTASMYLARRDRDAEPAVLHRRNRRPFDRAAGAAGAAAEAAEGPRPARRRLHPAAARHFEEERQPRPGGDGNHRSLARRTMRSGRSRCRRSMARPTSSSPSSAHGPTGTVQLQFDGSVTRFSDLAPEGLS